MGEMHCTSQLLCIHQSARSSKGTENLERNSAFDNLTNACLLDFLIRHAILYNDLLKCFKLIKIRAGQNFNEISPGSIQVPWNPQAGIVALTSFPSVHVLPLSIKWTPKNSRINCRWIQLFLNYLKMNDLRIWVIIIHVDICFNQESYSN